MNAIWRLQRLLAVLLVMGMAAPALAADPKSSPLPKGEGQGVRADLPKNGPHPNPLPKGEGTSKKPAKSRALVTISKETTFITEPLRPDGYVDYVAALNLRQSRGVTPENNAAVLFWKGMGPAAIGEQFREKFFKMLGIPPLPLEGDYYVNLDTFAKRDNLSADPAEFDKKIWDEQSEAMQRPWTKKEFPVIAGWIEANKKPIDLFLKGIKRPRYYEPLLGEEPTMVIALLLPGIQQDREIARVLTARAMLRLGSGKVDEAWDDLLACHRLARLISQGPTLVDALVAIAIDGIACAGDQALIQYPGLTARQAKKIYNDLRSLPPLSKMGDKIDFCERCMFLDCVQMMARIGPSGMKKIMSGVGGGDDKENIFEKAASSLMRHSIDWNLILRMGNSWYDRIVEVSRKPTREQREKAWAKIEEDIRKLSKKAKDFTTLPLAMLNGPRKAVSERLGQMFVALLLPAINAALNAEDRGAMQQEMTRLGFALAAYKADHGTYPKKLAELSPRYAAEIPKDIFTGGELIYRPQDKGFLLYSVGRNDKDNGGLGENDRTEDEATWECDDLAVRVPAKPKAEKKE